MVDGEDLSTITLVLLPGLEGSGDLFANLLPELPQTLNVITAAYPTQRFLPYPELVSWLSDLVPKDGPYVLIAESYGTPLAVKFAATHPPNLAGIVLSAGFISNPVRSWGLLPKLLARPLLFRFRLPDFLLEYFLVGPRASESLKLAVRHAMRSVSAEVLAERARAVIGCDARLEIGQVNVPMLYLRGTEDRLVGKESLDQIKNLHPATISFSVRAPHLLLQREPRIAARAIVQFLETQCPRKDLGPESSSITPES